MKRRRQIAAAASLACLLGASVVARGDGDFARKTQEADRTLAFIEQMTTSIEQMRASALERGQALRGSCLDVQLKAARDNRQVARGIRKRWDAGETSPEYLARSTERLMRLQVYAMVFEDEARGCTSAENVARGLNVVSPSAAGAREGLGATYAVFDRDTPQPPRLERPPLASPF